MVVKRSGGLPTVAVAECWSRQRSTTPLTRLTCDAVHMLMPATTSSTFCTSPLLPPLPPLRPVLPGVKKVLDAALGLARGLARGEGETWMAEGGGGAGECA